MNNIILKNELSMREKVNLAQSEMEKMPQLEMKYEHIFSDGIYARKLYIPKDAVVVGKIHKYANLNLMVKGKMQLVTDTEVIIVEAPFEIVSPPNTKRMARALEDTIWITILRTDEINIEKIEDHFTCNTETEFLQFCENSEKQLKLALEHV